jgi:hypothetical protein
LAEDSGRQAITARIADAQQRPALLDNEVPAELSRADLTTVLGDMSTLLSALTIAGPATNPDIYRDLGLRMKYRHETGEAEVEVSTAEACAERGVRGGT